jgi:hypothetical protein
VKTLPADCTAPVEVVSMRAPRVPAEFAGYSALTQARRSTSARLAGLELPAAFVSATCAAAMNAHERTSASAKASRRRLLEKATKLAGVQS